MSQSNAATIDELFGNPEAVAAAASGEPVDAAKGTPLAELCRVCLALRGKVDEREAELKKLKGQLEAVNLQILTKMSEEKLGAVRAASGHLFSEVVKNVYALPNKDQVEARERCRKWLRRVGLGALIEESVNAQTLTKALREREAAGRGILELIRVTPIRTLSVRKS